MLSFFSNGEETTAMAAPNDPKKVFCYRERSTIHNGLTRFYSSTKFSDITIVAPDGQKIFVHQVVLASCSKRFADVLEQGSLNGEELPVRGVDPTGLESVLKFFYTGECNLDHTNVIPVYDAAHRLDVPGLSAACEQFMREILGPMTACMLLQQTVQFLMQDYADQCMGVIRASFEESTNSDDFLTVHFQTLLRILNDASTASLPDMMVFKAGWRWGLSDVSHMLYLPEILKLLKVPEVPMEELVKLVPSPAPPPDSEDGADETAHVPSLADANATLHQMLIDEMLSSNDVIAAVGKISEEATAISNAAAAAAAAAGPSGGSPLQGSAVQLLQQAAGMVMQTGDKQSGTPGQMAGMSASFSGGGQPQLMLNQPAGEQQMDSQGNYPRLRLEPLRMEGGNSGQANGNFPMGGTLVLQPFNQSGGQNLMSSQLTPHLGNSSYGSLLMQDNPLMGTPGNRAHNSSCAKGICQVEGCYQDLAGLRDYHVRYKICETHLKAPFIHKDGHPHRFCQQCGRFHHLDEFDGEKRSCRARLMKHNARRRKKADGDMADGQSSPKHQRMMDGSDMMHHAFSGGFNASLQYQDYLPVQGGGSMLPGVGALGMGMPPRLSPAALSMLADAAQQDGGNGAATAAALSALGALAAAPSDDGSASMMMGMLGGGGSSADDAARVEQTQQMLAELAAGNGMAAWQGALRAVAATMGGGGSHDGEGGAAAALQQAATAGGVDVSSLDPLLDLLARTTAAAAAAGHGGDHSKQELGMDEAQQHALLVQVQAQQHAMLAQAHGHEHDQGQAHEHDQGQAHEHDHVQAHEHSHVQAHEHDHMQGQEHDHMHAHEHDQGEGQEHDHMQGQEHDHMQGHAHDHMQGQEHGQMQGQEHDQGQGQEHDHMQGNEHDHVQGHEHDQMQGQEGHHDAGTAQQFHEQEQGQATHHAEEQQQVMHEAEGVQHVAPEAAEECIVVKKDDEEVGAEAPGAEEPSGPVE